MNKIISLLALAIVAGASCSDASAKNKKKVAEPVAPVKEIVSLQTKSDSISYAAGQAFTNGLMPYVEQQLKVDTAYMADFIAGLKDALNMSDTPADKARLAGAQIASMVRDRMIPNVKEQAGSSVTINEALLKRGFTDAVEKDASILSVEESSKYFEGEMKAIKDQEAAAAKAKGAAWLAENKKNAGVVELPSGLQYKIITAGNGPVAEADQDVVVKYEGKLLDGTVFDSSYTRNPQTTTFKPSQVIKGWTEALTMMPQGSTWELYIPENLGYGERGAGPKIPPYSTLIFKVEVVEVKAKDKIAVIDAPVQNATAGKKAATKKATAKKATTKKK